MEDAILSRIFDPVIKEKCILILGPDLCLNSNDKTINQLLKTEIENALGISVIKNYFPDDEFFQFTDDDDENTALGMIGDFFKKVQPSELQKKISEIPFSVIISTSPDRLLVDLFKQHNFDYTYAFYNQKGENKDIERPTRMKPLIYNLFGDIDRTESLVYTYDQLFEYLEAIFSKQDLPPTLKSILNDESNYLLFIGFSFEKWYFKLLLRLLKLYKIKSKYGSRRDPSIQVDLIRNFYTEQFKVKFIDYDEPMIIDAIYQKCLSQGLLRAKKSDASNSAPAVYISYAWGGEKEVLVDNLYSILLQKAYKIFRDKTDLGYKGDIRKFMDLLGVGAYVIVVISDKYLKSKNCMYEMLSIYENRDIHNRIFPIVMEDAKIYDAVTRADYNLFWQNEKAVLQKKYNELEDKAHTADLVDDLSKYDDFRRIIGEITQMLSNMNTLTRAQLEKDRFEPLLKVLNTQIQADTSK